MTPRGADLLRFLRRWFAANETSPTYDEIRAGLGLASKGCVHRLVSQLVREGQIHAEPSRYRSIRLSDLEVGRLRAEVADLVEALRPFAMKAEAWTARHPDKPGRYPASGSTQITHRLGDFRRAREVLAKHKEPK